MPQVRPHFRGIWIALLSVGMALAGGVRAEKAPEFALPGVTANIALADFKGKTVLVDFWASWCAPCRKSFPWLNDMQKKYGAKGLVIVGVNVDTERALADNFLRKLPADFRVAFDTDGKVASIYQLAGMPSSFLIDANGDIKYRHVGFRSEDQAPYEARIRELVESTH